MMEVVVVMNLNKGGCYNERIFDVNCSTLHFFGYLATLIFKARLDIFKETKNEKSNHTVKFKLYDSQDDKCNKQK